MHGSKDVDSSLKTYFITFIYQRTSLLTTFYGSPSPSVRKKLKQTVHLIYSSPAIIFLTSVCFSSSGFRDIFHSKNFQYMLRNPEHESFLMIHHMILRQNRFLNFFVNCDLKFELDGKNDVTYLFCYVITTL